MAFAPLADGTLAAVDLERGAPRWRIDIAVSSTPAVGGGRVFVASEGDIVAVEAASGAEVWRVSLPGTLAAPLDWDTGWLLASTTDGDLAAFRAQDGELLWRAGVGAPIAAGPSPALDRLYAGLDDGRVIAVDLATGAVRWERRLAGRITGLAAFDDQLITGTTENEVLSLGLVRGEQRWRIRVGGDPVGPASADDRHIYFAALDNVLRAVDRGSGNLRWMQPLPSRPSAGPLLVGTAVFVPFVSTALNAFAAADGKPLYAISASGELAGRPHLRTAGFITGARLVTMSRDGHLRGFGEAMEAPPAPLAVLPGVSVGG
jgi:outer membrane protein assembly factor BamB